MQQVILSKFFICALLISVMGFWNSQLLKMYRANQEQKWSDPMLVLAGDVLTKYGNWILLIVVAIRNGFSTLVIVVLGELIGAFLGRILFTKSVPSSSLAVHFSFIVIVICAIVILV
jgi:hypothetical protein